MALVRDHMSQDLLTVEPAVSLKEVAERMSGRDVGAALVIDGEELVGILTERDIMRAVGRGIDDAATVSAWMTKSPDTIEADETTRHAATLMLHGGFRHLPVTDVGQVVGMLSIRDLMRIALEDSAPRGV
jgi:CBS domain-containing protein